MSAQRDIEREIAAAEERGWELIRQKGHRILRWPPTGRKTPVPSSVSDHRALKNLRCQLRRMERGLPY